MGLFSFIKNAGAKLGIGKSTAEEAAEERAEKTEVRRKANAAAADRMAETINDLGLEVENLNISINGDEATVNGKALNQTTKEKVVLVIGNTEGIAQVNDLMDVENKEPEARFYTVKSGDSLSKISKDMYGDAMKYNTIFEANKPMLKDPDKIYPGQVLRIPHLDN